MLGRKACLLYHVGRSHTDVRRIDCFAGRDAVLTARVARSTPLTFGILAWMLFGAVLARSGILGRFSLVPPPIALLIAGGLIATIALRMSCAVRQLIELPFVILLAAQSFRVLVEILITRHPPLVSLRSR